MLILAFFLLSVFLLKSYSVMFYLCTLEYLVVLIYFNIWVFIAFFGVDVLFLVSFLVFMVCEGCLGLGLMLHMIRSFGDDYCSGFCLF